LTTVLMHSLFCCIQSISICCHHAISQL
jgi:hypothetical protein